MSNEDLAAAIYLRLLCEQAQEALDRDDEIRHLEKRSSDELKAATEALTNFDVAPY